MDNSKTLQSNVQNSIAVPTETKVFQDLPRPRFGKFPGQGIAKFHSQDMASLAEVYKWESSGHTHIESVFIAR